VTAKVPSTSRTAPTVRRSRWQLEAERFETRLDPDVELARLGRIPGFSVTIETDCALLSLWPRWRGPPVLECDVGDRLGECPTMPPKVLNGVLPLAEGHVRW
jgi:hypothetical protein